MPHFIIHCSQEVLNLRSQNHLMQDVFDTANATGLFDKNDIKVRVQPFNEFIVGGDKTNFIHVFSHIMQGRSNQQKAELSKAIVQKLKTLFPEISNIAMNVYEFEKATYCNRNMV